MLHDAYVSLFFSVFLALAYMLSQIEAISPHT